MPGQPWTTLTPMVMSVASPFRSYLAAHLRSVGLVLAITGALLGPAFEPAADALAARAVADDAVSTKINTRTTFDVLVNDPAGMAIVDHTDPAHGDLTSHGTEFTYLPDANFVGTDSFTYHARRGSGEPQTGTVTIEVTGHVTSVECRDDHLQADEDVPATIKCLRTMGWARMGYRSP